MYRSKVYGYEMTLISEVYISTLSALMKPHGLERYFVAVMYLNEHSGSITQTELGQVLRRDKVFTMRLVDALSALGFVERKQDSNDRRCHLVELTTKGKALIPLIEEAVAQTNELMFKDFSAEEKECFERGMTHMMKLLDTQPKPSFKVTASEKDDD